MMIIIIIMMIMMEEVNTKHVSCLSTRSERVGTGCVSFLVTRFLMNSSLMRIKRGQMIPSSTNLSRSSMYLDIKSRRQRSKNISAENLCCRLSIFRLIPF